MHSLLLTTVNGKRAVLLHAGSLFTEPVLRAQYAILPGAPPDTDYRVPVRHWRIEDKKVFIDAPDGDFVGQLFIVEEPIPKPRGMKTWRDGEWHKY